RRVEQAVALTHRTDRPDQVAAPDLLQDVAAGAGHDRGEQGFVVRKRGQHEYLGLGPLRSDLARRLDAAAVGQPDVHHDHVRFRPLSLDDSILDRSGLSHHTNVASSLEHGLETPAYDLVVIDQHKPKQTPLGPVLACHTAASMLHGAYAFSHALPGRYRGRRSLPDRGVRHFGSVASSAFANDRYLAEGTQGRDRSAYEEFEFGVADPVVELSVLFQQHDR